MDAQYLTAKERETLIDAARRGGLSTEFVKFVEQQTGLDVRHQPDSGLVSLYGKWRAASVKGIKTA